MPKALFDTNIYLTYLLSPDPVGTAVEWLLEAASRQRFVLLLPIEVMIELNSVARYRPRIARRVSQGQIEDLLRRLAGIATVLPLLDEAPPPVSRDPNDDFLIATGVIHKADFLVTRDRDLLILGTIINLRVVEPRAFLEHVQRSETES